MLQEATFEMTAVAFQIEKEADKALHVQFYTDAVEDAETSAKEGRPIFRETDFVMIMVPGDKYNIVRRPVQPRDLQRFADRYAAYKAGKNQERSTGTPLRMVPWLSKAQCRELEFFGCHTLEQLASIPDSSAQNFLAIQRLKQQAKDAIQAAKDAAPLLALRTEVERKDAELAEMRDHISQLKAALAQVQQSQNAKQDVNPAGERAARK